MLFFGKKHKLTETSFFDGFKDYHNHSLPAVDDGVKSLEESLEILAYYQTLKVSDVVLTPHAMTGVNESDDAVNAAFERLKSAYEGPINLTLASEYMLDYNFLEHFKRGARMLVGSNILVETSYFSSPANLTELLYDISVEGVTPIIAHPERYVYMSRSQYHTLKDREYGLQLNLLSFSDIYGDEVTKNALYLLENNMYDIVGTDIHSYRSFTSRIEKMKLSTKQIDKLMEVKSKGLE